MRNRAGVILRFQTGTVEVEYSNVTVTESGIGCCLGRSAGTTIIRSSTDLPYGMANGNSPLPYDFLNQELFEFRSHDAIPTIVEDMVIGPVTVPKYTNEFWTSRQRQASSIHEISYRACFKPQLPRFFINLLTRKGDIVYDPFSGRGTTVIEAGLLGRDVFANDANPLSRIMTEPRFFPPDLTAVEKRLTPSPVKAEGHQSIFPCFTIRIRKKKLLPYGSIS